MNVAPVIRAARVKRTQAEAFRIFTEQIGAWWPLPTHGLFGELAGGVQFRNGQLVEVAVDGREAVWGHVLAWDPPNQLTISWHPGRDAEDGSEIDVVFEADGDGTRVVIEHRAWDKFGEAALERRSAYAGPNAWGYVLDHFGSLAEPPPAAPDISALSAAYDAFFAEAERGGFNNPKDGGWNAEETIGHVALNDLAMIAVAQSLVHGKEPRFENDVCQDREVLAKWIEATGGLSELTERGRALSAQALAAIHRLSPQQRATAVHCCLNHDGETTLDRPVPWDTVAIDTQAGMHLPAHVEQLQKLRA